MIMLILRLSGLGISVYLEIGRWSVLNNNVQLKDNFVRPAINAATSSAGRKVRWLGDWWVERSEGTTKCSLVIWVNMGNKSIVHR